MMSDGVRLAILTQYAAPQQAGGVEVFNDCLRRTFGGAEIFADGGPEKRRGRLRRVGGLEQPAEAPPAARTLLRRHREEPFDLIVSNRLYGWPVTLPRPVPPPVEGDHRTKAGLAQDRL